MKKRTKTIIKAILSVLAAIIATLCTIFGVTSCEVVRTITNTSKYINQSDTTTVIETRTIESYNATKH